MVTVGQRCVPWCTCQDDHLQDETGPYHFGPEHTVTLTLPDGDPREPTVSPSQLNVYLEQGAGRCPERRYP